MKRSLVLALLVVSCSAPPEQPSVDAAAPCTLQLEWGRDVDGAFAPFRDGDTAEITLGFQGFRFIDAIARIRGVRADEASFTLEATLDGHEPIAQDAGPFPAEVGSDGALYVHALQLFFNDVPLPELIGRTASVAVKGRAAGCTGETGARVSLVRGGCMGPAGEVVPCTSG